MDARWLGRRRRRPAPGSRLRGTGATSMAAQGCAKNGATTVSNSGSSIQGTRGLARGCALIRRRPAGGSFQRNEVAARQRELPTGARCAPGWPPSGVKRFGFHEGGKGRFGRWAMAFFSERGRLNGKGQVTRRAGQGQGRVRRLQQRCSATAWWGLPAVTAGAHQRKGEGQGHSGHER